MNSDLDNRIFQLDFAVEKSMRYHQRRRGWYETLHKGFMLVIIVCGSLASLSNGLAFYLGITVAGLAALDLVFGLSHRARDHEMLFRRFSDLAVKIRADEHTEENLKQWTRERINIETDEPPIYAALEADCDNKVRRAWDKTDNLVQLDGWSKFAMHFLRQEKKYWPQPS